MDEQALRALIREAVARQMATGPEAVHDPLPVPVSFRSHASHYRYALPESGGACLIEPAVLCNHCGYCQSHGH
jgi:hypothetical protein